MFLHFINLYNLIIIEFPPIEKNKHKKLHCVHCCVCSAKGKQHLFVNFVP